MVEKDILTVRQKALLEQVAGDKELAQAYVLSGGTALAAFYMHHRLSEDLDFFTQEPVNFERVTRFMEECKYNLSGIKLNWQKLYDRHIFLLTFPDNEELKVEFTQYPYENLDEPISHDGVLVASVRDISAGKLMAILDRNEPKDYYDLYFLLSEGLTTLDNIRNDVKTKYDREIDPLYLGSELEKGVNFPAIPQLIKKVEKADVQRFFENLAKSLRDEVVEENE